MCLESCDPAKASAFAEVQMSKGDAAAFAGQLTCPGCQRVIGDLYLVKGRLYCLHGAIMARVFVHNCPACSRSYHWHAAEVEKRAAGILASSSQVPGGDGLPERVRGG